MSGKKETKAAAPKVQVSKKDPAEKIKRNADGSKIMKVIRGTARAIRRAGLVKNWRTAKGAKQMLPSAVLA